MFVGAVVGALILTWFISSVGFEISMTAAVGALFVGRAVGAVLPLLLIKTAGLTGFLLRLGPAAIAVFARRDL